MAVPGEGGLPPSMAVQDSFRVEFFASHLAALCEARQSGANVTALYAWSFLDSYSWLEGYIERWGLVNVDYSERPGSMRFYLDRTPKASALWLSEHFFGAGA